jgi:UDP-N-acetyl-D-mannosaminuronic acid dehydrogenase
VLESVAPHLRRGHLICLRSTVAPGTTHFVERWLAPPYGFQGRARPAAGLLSGAHRRGQGLRRDPVPAADRGAEDAESQSAAAALFGRLAPEIMRTNYVSAELVKLFNNIARYVHFALANQFALIADTHGANIHEIRHGQPQLPAQSHRRAGA